ncbi:MAG: hypothetical protein JST35_07565 [Armatimonadetes bacterium]|nr:hypothetical protein [Armatimonadota bacterium]
MDYDQLDKELMKILEFLSITETPTQEWLKGAMLVCLEYESALKSEPVLSEFQYWSHQIANVKVALAFQLQDWRLIEDTCQRVLDDLLAAAVLDDLSYIHFLVGLAAALYAQQRVSEVEVQIVRYASLLSVKKIKHGIRLSENLSYALHEPGRLHFLDHLKKALRDKIEQEQA